MSGVIPSERAWRRTAAAVRTVEALGLGGKNPAHLGSWQAFAAVGANISGSLYAAEEKRLGADGTVSALTSPRIWDADRPLLVLGYPPTAGQLLHLLQVATPDGPRWIANNSQLPRVTRRITGNADFGAALWDGTSTVGTDEMWEEYAELNLATGRYEKKARKLFGACP